MEEGWWQVLHVGGKGLVTVRLFLLMSHVEMCTCHSLWFEDGERSGAFNSSKSQDQEMGSIIVWGDDFIL